MARTPSALTIGTIYRAGIRQKNGAGSDAILEGYLATGDDAFGAPFAAKTTGNWTTRADRFRFGATTGTVDALFDNIRLDSASMPAAGSAPGRGKSIRAIPAPHLAQAANGPRLGLRLFSRPARGARLMPLLAPPAGQIWKSYYYAGGQRVAMRVDGDPANNGVFFLLGDHLGSTSIIANGTTGALVAELRYKAWGENRYANGTTPTTYQYTGQRREASLGGAEGLYFYNARWYDPCSGEVGLRGRMQAYCRLSRTGGCCAAVACRSVTVVARHSYGLTFLNKVRHVALVTEPLSSPIGARLSRRV